MGSPSTAAPARKGSGRRRNERDRAAREPDAERYILPIVDLRSTARPALEGEGEKLKPYVPRLLIEWVRESPASTYRARDGSLAFVDISGFTALTERLARRGKIGAELLRDTLDGVFSGAPRRGVRVGRRAAQVGRRRAPAPVRRARPPRAAPLAPPGRCSARSSGSAGSASAGGTVALRMSVGIATGHDRLLHGRERPPRAADRRPDRDRDRPDGGGRGRGRDRAQPDALAQLLDPSCVGPREGGGAPPRRRRRTPSERRAPDVGSVSGLDVALLHPARGA